MSLTGAAIGVDATLLTKIVGDATTFARYSRGSSTNVTRSCDIAADEFRDAAIKGGYLDTDIDALTSSSLHVRWQEYVGWYAIDDLTVGIGVPDDIRKRCDDAKKHFSWLATGNAQIDGLTRIVDTGGVSHRAAPERKFDRNNVSQKYQVRDPEI